MILSSVQSTRNLFARKTATTLILTKYHVFSSKYRFGIQRLPVKSFQIVGQPCRSSVTTLSRRNINNNHNTPSSHGQTETQTVNKHQQPSNSTTQCQTSNGDKSPNSKRIRSNWSPFGILALSGLWAILALFGLNFKTDAQRIKQHNQRIG